MLPHPFVTTLISYLKWVFSTFDLVGKDGRRCPWHPANAFCTAVRWWAAGDFVSFALCTFPTEEQTNPLCHHSVLECHFWKCPCADIPWESQVRVCCILKCIIFHLQDLYVYLGLIMIFKVFLVCYSTKSALAQKAMTNERKISSRPVLRQAKQKSPLILPGFQGVENSEDFSGPCSVSSFQHQTGSQ